MREISTLQLEAMVKEETEMIVTYEAKMGEHTAVIERQRAMESKMHSSL
jgi:hypothetical protein